MLLHSPSGAGKTSLIQTSVVPAFEKRGFLVCATTDTATPAGPDDGIAAPYFAALRVNLAPPTDTPVGNRYVFSVVNGLIGSHLNPVQYATMTLAEALDEFSRRHGAEGKRQLILVDQLEEILIVDPADLEAKAAFFRELGVALEDDRRWALLAIREDYMGGLDRFQRYLPGQLRSTFRLDLLDTSGAMRAVQEPARKSGVDFNDEAASTLVRDLGRVHSGMTGEAAATVAHPYIEPVLLQVVCYSLFDSFSPYWTDETATITVQNVESFKPFDKSIGTYYETVLGNVVGGKEEDERVLRDWIEHRLITRKRLRRPNRQRPATPRAEDYLGALRDHYLIRDDPRPGGSRMWELSHDMLVGPILENNRAWRARHLELWQCQAEDWRASKQNPQYLLRGDDYSAAPPPARRDELNDTEREFLAASDEVFQAERSAAKAAGMLAGLAAQLSWVRGLLAVSLLANVVLLFFLVSAILM